MSTWIIMNYWGECYGPFPTEEAADDHGRSLQKSGVNDWNDWDTYEVKAPTPTSYTVKTYRVTDNPRSAEDIHD